MARTCLFCNRTDLTLEHVWPDWISKFLFGEPKKARFTATQWPGVDRKAVATYRAPELNHQARIVCEKCNGGWMSDIETTTADILQPMLLGRTVRLSNYEQTVIRACGESARNDSGASGSRHRRAALSHAGGAVAA